MLLELKFKNWRSFYDECYFSMIATRERDPFARLTTDSVFNGRVIPVSAIYGYNASGKSNFIDAIKFLQSLVLHRERVLKLQPFAFVRNYLSKTSDFCIKFFNKSTVYNYEISLNSEKIFFEKLSIEGKNSIITLFERRNNELSYLCKSFSDADKNRLNIIMLGTANNQTFLNNTYTQRVDLS